ncbi:hypothetical protein GXB81_19170 [Paraburkholderia sp. Ac-20336]|uniref:hypothetical protein n=1 Tax=Paraburkholderia sp. Ac-20336 TaxID=2703886 RepID=UPI001981A63E|nr:hypothetical protein [Paraburkholderia sp. Ac-20336]MBN3805152.1 hypothetical protein [Paraburkholderia sp. Ac-20336]
MAIATGRPHKKVFAAASMARGKPDLKKWRQKQVTRGHGRGSQYLFAVARRGRIKKQASDKKDE